MSNLDLKGIIVGVLWIVLNFKKLINFFDIEVLFG